MLPISRSDLFRTPVDLALQPEIALLALNVLPIRKVM